MKTVKVCIRVDIDTIKDTEVLHVLLEILDAFDINASFFVTTGPDATFKNYKNYHNPLKLLRNKALKQHGIRQIFRGLFYKQQVQKFENVRCVLEKGHELGLHGYHHYDWMNTLQLKNKDEITAWITKGCELFEEAYGFRPHSFASPGFASCPAFLEALDSFAFEYSSDFRGTEAFYPPTDSRNSSTLQLPVAERSFGELEARGAPEEDIYDQYIKDLNNAQDFFIFYMHPSYEPIINRKLLIKLLEHITSSNKFEIITLSQLAKCVKRREQAEDTTDLRTSTKR